MAFANFVFLELLNWYYKWLGLDKELKRLVIETTGNQVSVVASVLGETIYMVLFLISLLKHVLCSCVWFHTQCFQFQNFVISSKCIGISRSYLECEVLMFVLSESGWFKIYVLSSLCLFMCVIRELKTARLWFLLSWFYKCCESA